MTNNENKKCGFVSIVGATNAGKSTLMNAIVGKFSSIVSHKVQTTRNQIRGIKNFGNTQIVFIDTPGIFDAKNKFDNAMVKSAVDSTFDTDVVLLIIDSVKGISKNSQKIINILKDSYAEQSIDNRPKIFVVLNKVDLVNKVKLLELAQQISEYKFIDKIFMISALKNDGVKDIVNSLIDVMPESNWFYDKDNYIDLPDAVYYADITREQIYKFLHKELPYDISVITDSIKYEKETDTTIINQTIYVARVSQRKIVIGDNANVIKLIGSRSRDKLKQILQRNVRLFLYVKVQENWRNNKEFFEEIGLEF